MSKKRSIFDTYFKLTQKPLKAPEDLSLDERCLYADTLRKMGETIPAIIDYFGNNPETGKPYSSQTIYNWISRVTKNEIAELENKTQIELFMDQYLKITATRDKMQRDLNAMIEEGSAESIRNAIAQGKTIKDYDKMIFDMFMKTSLITNNDSYSSLAERNGDDSDTISELDSADSEQLTEMLIKKLMQKRNNVTLRDDAHKRVL